MKTIAITIDEDILERIDKAAAPGGRTRSGFIREALRDYLFRIESQAEEEREREIFKRHRDRIHSQALALIDQQAKP